MPLGPDEICARPDRLPNLPTKPHAAPLYTTSVWECDSTQQADDLLAGRSPGYVYQRDSHPNGDLLAEKCRELHGAQEIAITASGMSALALAVLSQLQPGDHVVVSNQLYGRSLLLFTSEAGRWGIRSTVVDTCDLTHVESAMTERTRMVVAETISNPRLHVVDIAALAELSHRYRAKLLIDNTFASPVLCRPMDHGADLVMESVSKMMNGHSDVILGLLCGRTADWERVRTALLTWGLASNPFDCWLSSRGLVTLSLRMARACENAVQAARFLEKHSSVARVDYPGLAAHPQHELAKRQFGNRFGSVVTFHLHGGREAADRFIASARRIPFCPSLGEANTTLSHPPSTSHRGLTEEQRQQLGISGGTIRLSVGIEGADDVISALNEGLEMS